MAIGVSLPITIAAFNVDFEAPGPCEGDGDCSSQFDGDFLFASYSITPGIGGSCAHITFGGATYSGCGFESGLDLGGQGAWVTLLSSTSGWDTDCECEN
jgi:hypothetical protein